MDNKAYSTDPDDISMLFDVLLDGDGTIELS